MSYYDPRDDMEKHAVGAAICMLGVIGLSIFYTVVNYFRGF